MNDQERLQSLIVARHACIRLVTHDEDYALSLVREAALSQGLSLRLWSIIGGVRDGLVAGTPPDPDTEHPAAALYCLEKQLPEPCVMVMLDLASHLKDERTLRLLRDLISAARKSGATLVMIDHADSLPPVIVSEATPFIVSLPDAKELEEIVRDALRRVCQERGVKTDISRRAFRTILRNLRGLTRRRAEQIIIDCVAEDRRFDAEDINTVLSRKRQMLAGAGLLEFVETPVDLNEIGGLRRLKRWLKLRESAITDAGALYGLLAPRGVMMLGVQGAGKSLCAKAIATAWHRPLLRMDVGALYDRYVGESERRLRDALRQADAMAPIVLWIDEIEKGFASAASRSTDGGLSQRMFGALLTWMQEHEAPVFLVATANDIEALPPELLRKGRFDEIFFVDLPKRFTRRRIFEIHLKKRGRDPAACNIMALADAADGFSGAEIEQAIISAMHEAFADQAEVDTNRILQALRSSPPLSVTMAERVERLRAWAKGRCVPAD
ncbi:MAG: AAA family ATPase [Phycisphaerales bacterium]|nr:MAG: AAA family ATPase [Phycisphaerales bacterium]